MLLAPVIALLSAHGIARGFFSWQAVLTASLWALPGLARPAAQHLLLPLAVPLMLALFLLLTSRYAPANARHGKQSAKVYDKAVP
jgi:H+/Cl- antiporter ClcA